MTTFGRTIGTGAITALMLAGLITGAQAFVSGGGMGSFGGELRGVTQIKGKVVCVGCSLDEMRAAQPELQRLYQLNHAQGQLVMTVESVNEVARWESIVGLSHHLAVRAPASLFQQLTAEENLFKEVVILGLLRSNRTLDMGEVIIPGPSIAELARAAGERAQAAADRAEAAALQAEGTAERVDRTVQQIEAMVKKFNGGDTTL
jgi:hypothetical protein